MTDSEASDSEARRGPFTVVRPADSDSAALGPATWSHVSPADPATRSRTGTVTVTSHGHGRPVTVTVTVTLPGLSPAPAATASFKFKLRSR